MKWRVVFDGEKAQQHGAARDGYAMTLGVSAGANQRGVRGGGATSALGREPVTRMPLNRAESAASRIIQPNDRLLRAEIR